METYPLMEKLPENSRKGKIYTKRSYIPSTIASGSSASSTADSRSDHMVEIIKKKKKK